MSVYSAYGWTTKSRPSRTDWASSSQAITLPGTRHARAMPTAAGVRIATVATTLSPAGSPCSPARMLNTTTAAASATAISAVSTARVREPATRPSSQRRQALPTVLTLKRWLVSRPSPQASETKEKRMGVLDGKVAIVTGSARGIGRATAELLSEQGAKVLINDLDADVAEQTASEIAGDTAVYGGDLTKPGAPDELIAKAIDSFGQIDIIVNNAGYTLDAPIHKMSDEQFQRMLDIHTVVPFRVIRAAAPHLREPAKKEREEGREVFRKIVNVSSISGTMGNAGQANYSAGKAAVVGLTETLAKEWGQFKINVNAVAFGYIETRLTASKDEANTMEIGGEKVQLGIPDQLRGMAAMLIPLGRPGSPEEAAGGVFFLCSPWSNYVHGQTLNVTGGQFTGMTT